MACARGTHQWAFLPGRGRRNGRPCGYKRCARCGVLNLHWFAVGSPQDRVTPHDAPDPVEARYAALGAGHDEPRQGGLFEEA